MAQASNQIEITHWIRCPECVEFWKGEGGLALDRMESRLLVGQTPVGVQIWCAVHNRNVAHFHFEGQRHPVNTSKAPAYRPLPKGVQA